MEKSIGIRLRRLWVQILSGVPYTELAQLEERGPYKADVMGSSPLLRTIKDPYSKIFSQNCKFWMKFLLGLVYARVLQ